MLAKTIRLYFGMTRRVASSMAGYLIEHESEVSEIIAAANDVAEVFSEESASYQEHCSSIAELLKKTFVKGSEE